MRSAYAWFALALATVAPLAVAAGRPPIDPRRGCRSNPAVVAPCFDVDGRAVITNGTPSMRIFQRGTDRILGVAPAEHEIAPACLREAVGFERKVVGTFTVCPFSAQKPGAMQLVCVQEMRHAVVRPADDERAECKLADCALLDKTH